MGEANSYYSDLAIPPLDNATIEAQRTNLQEFFILVDTQMTA